MDEPERTPAPVRRAAAVSAPSRLVPQPRTLSDEAATEIRRRIDAGELASGARIPSERELAEQLGISRTVLRESLRRLEASGYLFAQPGRGRYVAGSLPQEESDPLIVSWLWRHQGEVRDLVELRSCIESQALRGTPDDARVLATEVAPLIEAQDLAIAEGRHDDAAALDFEFHVLLTSRTRNRPLRSLGLALIARAREAARAAYRMSSYRQESLRQHREIVAALAAGDLTRASELVGHHHASRAERLARDLQAAGVGVRPSLSISQ